MSVTWKASKGPSASSNTHCTVRLLDGTDVLLDIGKKTEGHVLFEQIIRRLEITQKEYFGLEFEDDHKIPQWLDLSKPVRKQIKRTPYRVSFKVRHYPLDPMASRPSSRTQFYQQVRKDIIEGKLRCPDHHAPTLISYILQADLGDYENTDTDIEYMSDERLVSNEDITLQEEISRSHKLLRGFNPQESVTGFLRKVRDLDNYGMVSHDIKLKEGPGRVGLSPRGLSLYRRNQLINVYDWSSVSEISFKSKKLTMTLKDEKGTDKQVVLERDSTKAAKELWTACAQKAEFYSQPSHRTKEEVEVPIEPRSPGVVTPTKDIFGYPEDSRDEPSFGEKVKRSKSLPQKLPSDDPVLVAAMAHRGNGQPRDPPHEVTDSPNLANGTSMHLMLPDMPNIVNRDRYSPTHENVVLKRGQDVSHMQARTDHHGDMQDHHGDVSYRSHDPQHVQHDVSSRNEQGVQGLKSGSRLSQSSQNSSNLSQDDDMDGSLLDLADELGDEETGELTPVEKQPGGMQERTEPNTSPRRSPVKQSSQTLPRSFDSPKPVSPSKPRHHSTTEGLSPHKRDHTTHPHGSPPHQAGSAHTTGREHKKKKDGKQLVRMWVQEQQQRMFQSSQESTSSSSIGGNLDHLQPSPELRASQPHHTPPRASQPHHTPPRASHHPPPSQPPQPSPQPTSPQHGQGPPKPPRTYYPTSNELYDHISHSQTLPSPRKARKMADSSPTTQSPLVNRMSPTKPYKSSEQLLPGHDTRANVDKHGGRVPDPLHEIDDLMNELTVVDSEVFVKPGSSTSSPRVGGSPYNSTTGTEPYKPHSVSDSNVEQARHDRRASERKLRKSQKVVNQLLSENRGDARQELHREPQNRARLLSSPEKIDWFDRGESKERAVSQREVRSSFDMSQTDRRRMTSPTGGADLRNLLQEVMESDSLARPPAHLVALSQEMEQVPYSRSSELSPPPTGVGHSVSPQHIGHSVSPQHIGHSVSPQHIGTSSLSSYDKGSSKQASADRLNRGNLDKKDFDLMDGYRRSSGTANLPPAIASFMSRVRNKTPEYSDSQSDEIRSPTPYSEPKNSSESFERVETLSPVSREGELPQSPTVVVVPPTYDSPRLVRMEMFSFGNQNARQGSEISSKNDTLKHTSSHWVDDDAKLPASSSSPVSSANAQTPTTGTGTSYYGSDTPGTVTTSSSSRVENAYDTPRAIHKPLATSVVHPEQGTREPVKSPPFADSNRLQGIGKHPQRGNSYDSSTQQQLSPTYFDEPEVRRVASSNSFRHEPASITVTQVSQRPLASPTTPLTPLSQHTHSDIAPNTFLYPPFPTASAPPVTTQSHEAVNSAHSQFTRAQVSQGYAVRPEAGQGYQLNQANPRSRQYKPQPQGYVGGDVRRTQTFSSGRESGWSNRYHQDERRVTSPSDDSLPNSPTYFIHNNPNDERDTPSPATQAQNASFQEHLKQLEGRGSRKMRVLDWMQTTDSQQQQRQVDTVPLKKDFATVVPAKPYQKAAPVYASIDDLEDAGEPQRTNSRPGSGIRTMSSASQRPGSRPASGRQDPRHRAGEVQREQERLTQKLSSHSASGYDMEQRQRGMAGSRPYSRHDQEQRRVEMDPQFMDTQPASQIQRRAYTVSHPPTKLPPPHSQSYDPRAVSRNTIAPSTGTTTTGYPSTKYAGKDYYVIDV